MTKSSVYFQDVSLKFRVYKNPSPALKESVVNTLQGRKNGNTVLELFGLKNVSFRIESGERVGVLGLNGAGKSTLLKTLVGIYKPSQGQIVVQGKLVPLIELGTGFDLELSGRENIQLNGALLGRSPNEMAGLESTILDFAELDEFADVAIKYYSTGMLGRLAFSIATMVEPEILLVDEIFSTGDAAFINKSVERMNELMRRAQIVIMTGHNTHLLRQCCNRILIMHRGEIVNDGEPQKMIAFFEDNLVAASKHARSVATQQTAASPT